jgi:hypothetical protein
MSSVAATGAAPRRSATRTTVTVTVADARRGLQLALAGLWLLDGVLQLQPFMFTTAFARQVLATSATNNPAVVAGPINAVSHLVAHHPVGANAAFATAQLLLGLGIAWRPTVKPALVASIVWALSVWWLGEGLGGVLTGHASLVAGGPGAAVLYALLALVVWPPSTSGPERRFVAAGMLGVAWARALWLIVWTALGVFTLDGVGRSPQGLHDMIAAMATGQPGWLAAVGDRAADVVAGRGLAASIMLAVCCVAVGVGMYGSWQVVRITVVATMVIAIATWVATQALGGVFGGQGTDPGTGPLLVLLALAYWPLRRAATHDHANDSC